MNLTIIIVNWNTGQQLRQCLESIVQTDRDGFELGRVVVVDNASNDGSADGLEDLNLPLSIIRNAENRGFGAACNQAAQEESDYLLFLNPDARLFENSLRAPLSFMEQPDNRQIGIVGIQLVDDSGRVSRTCVRFPTPRLFFSKMLGMGNLFPHRFPSHFMTDWDHGESREVDHVIGAFFLVRRSLFESLGGFDERFFLYLEDLDFSLRAWRVGWRSYYYTGSQAYHRGGGASEQAKAIAMSYSLRSRILYSYKHLGWWAATGLMLTTLLLEPFTRIGFAISTGSWAQVKHTLEAYAMLWGAWPSWITRRYLTNEPDSPS